MNFNVSPHLRPVCHSFSTALATVLRSRTIVDSLNHSLQCQIKLFVSIGADHTGVTQPPLVVVS